MARSNLEFLPYFIISSCLQFYIFVLLLISCLFRSHQDVSLFRLVWGKEVEQQFNPTGAIRCGSYSLAGWVGLDEAPCGLHFVLDPKPISHRPRPKPNHKLCPTWSSMPPISESNSLSLDLIASDPSKFFLTIGPQCLQSIKTIPYYWISMPSIHQNSSCYWPRRVFHNIGEL